VRSAAEADSGHAPTPISRATRLHNVHQAPRAESGRVPANIAMIVASEYHVDARVRRQAEALVARGDRVTAISLGRSSNTVRRISDGVSVVELPVAKYRGDSAAAYASYYGRFALLAARELLRIKGPDLIQVHSMPEALVFCAIPQRLKGTPVLLDVHDLTSKLFETKFKSGLRARTLLAIERASMRFASQTMTVHRPYAEMLKAKFGRAVGEVPIVLNVPDARRWKEREWRPWGDEVVFSFHGSLVERYGVIDMIDALARVREHRPARLLVRGGGDARAPMIDRIKQHGLEDAVDVSPGYVALDEMPGELEPAHIGLAPYRFDPFMADSLPSKLLEYAAMGLPVVASSLPYIRELFGDSLLYAEPGDVSSLTSAMLRAADGPAEARRRAAAAKDVVARLSWDTQRDTYLGVIDSLLPRRVAVAVGI
jgi:glycosyltransferase involved in cell wall biosynthesis